MADLRIKQAIMDEERHEPWKKLDSDKNESEKATQLKKPEIAKEK